jgi:hypothetical protein
MLARMLAVVATTRCSPWLTELFSLEPVRVVELLTSFQPNKFTQLLFSNDRLRAVVLHVVDEI